MKGKGWWGIKMRKINLDGAVWSTDRWSSQWGLKSVMTSELEHLMIYSCVPAKFPRKCLVLTWYCTCVTICHVWQGQIKPWSAFSYSLWLDSFAQVISLCLPLQASTLLQQIQDFKSFIMLSVLGHAKDKSAFPHHWLTASSLQTCGIREGKGFHVSSSITWRWMEANFFCSLWGVKTWLHNLTPPPQTERVLPQWNTCAWF